MSHPHHEHHVHAQIPWLRQNAGTSALTRESDEPLPYAIPANFTACASFSGSFTTGSGWNFTMAF